MDDARRDVSLGGASRVPYPRPTDAIATATAKGKANKRSGTKPELRIRSALHRRGHRFRKDFAITGPGLRTHVDIAFTRRRVAVFVDGCFWHSCPLHRSTPKSNQDYWLPKLEANVARDRRVDTRLTELGWTVLRVWEHDDVDASIAKIEAALAGRAK